MGNSASGTPPLRISQKARGGIKTPPPLLGSIYGLGLGASPAILMVLALTESFQRVVRHRDEPTRHFHRPQVLGRVLLCSEIVYITDKTRSR